MYGDCTQNIDNVLYMKITLRNSTAQGKMKTKNYYKNFFK